MKDYESLFSHRAVDAEHQQEWLKESISLLEAYSSSASQDVEKAATAMIEDGWQPEALHHLAYAGFCFWHLPLKERIAQTPDGNKHRGANAALTGLLFESIQGNGDSEGSQTLEEANRLLKLASVAFRASAKSAQDFDSFQQDFFQNAAEAIIEETPLMQALKKWPACLKENGSWSPDAIEGKQYKPEVLQKILRLDPQAIAEKVSKIAVATAKKLNPSVFADFPPLTPHMHVDPNTRPKYKSGTYAYQPDGAQYYFDATTPSCSTTLPNLISATMHETYHLLQTHMMNKKGMSGDNPFLCEYLTQENIAKDFPLDVACRTYSAVVPSGSAVPPVMQPAVNAYANRPTERFTHALDHALEDMLCRIEGTPRTVRRINVSDDRLLASGAFIVPDVPKGRPTPPIRRPSFVL